MTPISSIILVTIGSFIGSFGAVFLKAGAARLRMDVRSVLTNWPLLAGVVTFLSSSIFFMLGLKHGELSLLYPLVSVGYIWTLLWSRLFFNEPFTKVKLLGVGMILFGVALVGFGTPNHVAAQASSTSQAPR